MGIYTSCRAELQLRADTPQYVIEAIKWLQDPTPDIPCPPVDEHQFWKLGRYQQVGSNYSSPFDWEGKTWDSTDRCFDSQLTWNELSQNPDGTWAVVISSNCKNYDFQIHEFIAWTKPFLTNQDRHAVALIRHEDWDTARTLYTDEV